MPETRPPDGGNDSGDNNAKNNTDEKKSKNKRRPGRRRRNKKDVILDLTKRRIHRTNAPSDTHPPPQTSAVKKRKFETTGQYLRRIDRMVAIAKVEANLESRFDVTISKRQSDRPAGRK